MGLFYTGIGLVAALVIWVVEFYGFNYEEPVVPASFVEMILAGPIEETIFFGLPYAITGNSFVVLGTGALWAFVHIFNAQLVEQDGFSFITVGFAIPHIFFSLRCWKSGKGWFTIPFHSAWNALVFGIAVAIGEIPFTIIDETFPGLDIAMAIIAAILMAITYPLYKRRLRKTGKIEKEKKPDFGNLEFSSMLEYNNKNIDFNKIVSEIKNFLEKNDDPFDHTTYTILDLPENKGICFKIEYGVKSPTFTFYVILEQIENNLKIYDHIPSNYSSWAEMVALPGLNFHNALNSKAYRSKLWNFIETITKSSEK